MGIPLSSVFYFQFMAVSLVRWTPSFGQPGSKVKVDSMLVFRLPFVIESTPPWVSGHQHDLSEVALRCSTATTCR